MTVTGHTQQSCRHCAPDDADWLEIEIVRDEHYKQNTVYRSWQEITAGDEVASTGPSPPRPLGDLATG